MDQFAEQFQRSLIYSSQADAPSLQADIQLLRDMDEHSEANQSKWTKCAIGFALVTAVCIGIAVSNDPPLPLLLIAAAIFGIGFIYSITRYLKFKRTNVDNRRYELLDELLTLISVDADHRHPIKVRLDCRPTAHKDKFVSKGKAGTWDVKYFADPWLNLTGRLLDGTNFELTKTELLQKRSKRKRSRSGKTKFKSKSKHGFEAELMLRFKPEKYRHMANLQSEAQDAIQVPAPVLVKRMRHTDRSIGLKVAHKGDWRGPAPLDKQPRGDQAVDATHIDATHTIAMMMLSLYQVLQLSKAIDKNAKNGDSK